LPVRSPGEDKILAELSASKVQKYSPVEVAIRIGTTYRNSFDPEEVNVALKIKTPSGASIAVPAFFCQDYQRKPGGKERGRDDWFYPAGMPVWKARFAPSEVGTYSAEVTRRDRSGTAQSDVLRFECVSSASKGFLRVSKKDPRFLEFTEGRPFFAVGQNLAFIGSGQYASLPKAEEMFGKLADNGANYLRIWVCCEDWATAVEAQKSAWTRSWGGKAPIVPVLDAQGKPTERKCITLGGTHPASVNVSTCNPVALRPETRYVVSGEVQTEGEAKLEVAVHGASVGEPIIGAKGDWARFQREFTTRPSQLWLGQMALRAVGQGGGAVRVTGLSLREAAGGPELLWEADVNRPVRGFYNPPDCFVVDKILEAAQQRGIYVQVCLVTRNLYMSDLKDPKSRQYDEVIRCVKNLFRYAVARWGHFTSVGAWEYFNEQDPGLPTDRFYAELGKYLEEIDPYRHPRCTSGWGPSPKDWRHAQLDLPQEHRYLRPALKEGYKDEVADVLERVALVKTHAPQKPVFLGEYGLAGDKWELSPLMKDDKDLVHFHNALWSSALSGAAGTALFWWWDQLDRMDCYQHYRPVSAFVADIPFTTAELQGIKATVSDTRARVVGLQGKDCAFAWLNNREATWWNAVVAKAAPQKLGPATLTVEGLSSGAYRVEWWDTYAGKIAKEEKASASDGRLVLQTPAFERDVACKVRR
jgi:hypothetical protein